MKKTISAARCLALCLLAAPCLGGCAVAAGVDAVVGEDEEEEAAPTSEKRLKREIRAEALVAMDGFAQAG